MFKNAVWPAEAFNGSQKRKSSSAPKLQRIKTQPLQLALAARAAAVPYAHDDVWAPINRRTVSKINVKPIKSAKKGGARKVTFDLYVSPVSPAERMERVMEVAYINSESGPPSPVGRPQPVILLPATEPLAPISTHQTVTLHLEQEPKAGFKEKMEDRWRRLQKRVERLTGRRL